MTIDAFAAHAHHKRGTTPLPIDSSHRLERDAMFRRKPPKLKLAHGIDPRTYISPAVPPGYCTVGLWWVTNQLPAFDLLENPQETVAADEDQLWRSYRHLAYEICWVIPSPAYANRGNSLEPAYRVHFLEWYFTQR